MLQAIFRRLVRLCRRAGKADESAGSYIHIIHCTLVCSISTCIYTCHHIIGALSISSIKALDGHRVAALSVIDSKTSMTLHDYMRSDIMTLQGGLHLLKSLTETIVALQDLGLVHGRIDASRVYVDWDHATQVKSFVYLIHF